MHGSILHLKCLPQRFLCQRLGPHVAVLLWGGRDVRRRVWVEGTRSLETLTWRSYVELGPMATGPPAFLSFAMRFFFHDMWSHLGPTDCGLITLKLWAKLRHSFFQIDLLRHHITTIENWLLQPQAFHSPLAISYFFSFPCSQGWVKAGQTNIVIPWLILQSGFRMSLQTSAPKLSFVLDSALSVSEKSYVIESYSIILSKIS